MEGTGRAEETVEAIALQTVRCQSQSERAISHTEMVVAVPQRRSISPNGPAIAGLGAASDAMKISGKPPTLEGVMCAFQPCTATLTRRVADHSLGRIPGCYQEICLDCPVAAGSELTRWQH